jgi:hypothetical protein
LYRKLAPNLPLGKVVYGAVKFSIHADFPEICGSGVGCAAAYRTAEQQQAAQPLSGPARRLAVHMMAEFFAQPIRGDKPALRLVVDNDSATPS